MSPDKIAAAEALKKIGKSYAEIAKMLDVHINQVKIQLDWDYWEMCVGNLEKMRLRQRQISMQRAVERAETRDVTGILLGDPTFERSALFGRAGGQGERERSIHGTQ